MFNVHSMVLLQGCAGRNGGWHSARVPAGGEGEKERLWGPLLQLDGGDSMPVRGCHYQVCQLCSVLGPSVDLGLCLARKGASPFLYLQVLSGENLLALAATPTRLFVFLGGPGLKGLFSGYASRSLGKTNLDICLHFKHSMYDLFAMRNRRVK